MATHIERRLASLERGLEAREEHVPPGACTDASAWTKRFRAFDPANAALLDAIARWDVAMHPWCTLSMEYGLNADIAFMRLASPLIDALVEGKHHDRPAIREAPHLLRRLVTALHGYQTATGDVLYDRARQIDALVDRPHRAGLHRVWLQGAEVFAVWLADPECEAARTMREGMREAAMRR